jgi:hypothetical protein
VVSGGLVRPFQSDKASKLCSPLREETREQQTTVSATYGCMIYTRCKSLLPAMDVSICTYVDSPYRGWISLPSNPSIPAVSFRGSANVRHTTCHCTRRVGERISDRYVFVSNCKQQQTLVVAPLLGWHVQLLLLSWQNAIWEIAKYDAFCRRRWRKHHVRLAPGGSGSGDAPDQILLLL